MEPKISLVIFPGNILPLEKSNHPAGLSTPVGDTKSKIPYESHEERIKFARMARDRMLGACAPEKSSDHGNNPAVSPRGRDAGQKKPHSDYSTKVSGMGSSAASNFGARTVILKPSEFGAGKPESAKAHQPRRLPKPKK